MTNFRSFFEKNILKYNYRSLLFWTIKMAILVERLQNLIVNHRTILDSIHLYSRIHNKRSYICADNYIRRDRTRRSKENNSQYICIYDFRRFACFAEWIFMRLPQV